MLYNLGVITFSPPLESRLRDMGELKSGDSWELQLRGCSIWAVEMIRRQIVQDHPEAESEVNAVLLDFLLYDLAKEFESTGTFRACGVLPALSRSTDFKTGVQSMWRSAGYTNTSNERRTQVYPQTDSVTQVQKVYPITGHEVYGTSDVLEKRIYKGVRVSLIRTLSPSLVASFLLSRHNLLSPFVLTVCEWVRTCNLPFTRHILRSFDRLSAHSVKGRLTLHSFKPCCCQLTTTPLPTSTVTNLPLRLRIKHSWFLNGFAPFYTNKPVLTNHGDTKKPTKCVLFW
jgi:hypothetical protein